MGIEQKEGGFAPSMDEPRRRRWWLLTKALESHPIREALEIAHAVERFLVGAEMAGDGQGSSRARLLRGEWEAASLGAVEQLAEAAPRAGAEPATDGAAAGQRSENSVTRPISADTDQKSDGESPCCGGDTLAAPPTPAGNRYLH